MSSDSSDSSDDEGILSEDIKKFRSLLKDLDQTLLVTVDEMQTVTRHIAKEESGHQDLYIATGLNTLLHKYIDNWKKEGRLNSNGSNVYLTKEEAIQIGVKEGWNSIYDLCAVMIRSLNKK